MESKALVKSTNDIVATRFFTRIPSKIRRIFKIWDVVDLFLWKPFWFFQSMFSILGSMRLRSRALYILAAMDERVITQLFWLIRGYLFREGEDASLRPCTQKVLKLNLYFRNVKLTLVLCSCVGRALYIETWHAMAIDYMEIRPNR